MIKTKEIKRLEADIKYLESQLSDLRKDYWDTRKYIAVLCDYLNVDMSELPAKTIITKRKT